MNGMREIKFRAFENGIMYQQVRCGGSFDGILTAPTTWVEEKGWVNLTGQPHTKVMQYTGLKDKNGVEIYEGDVLKIPDFYETPENTNATYHYEQTVFKYGAFCTHNYPMFEYQEYISEESEVIGNIYENPELLEGNR